MKKTEEIRKEARQLEIAINLLLNQFIERNGNCFININVNQHYDTRPGSGEVMLLSTESKVEVKIL